MFALATISTLWLTGSWSAIANTGHAVLMNQAKPDWASGFKTVKSLVFLLSLPPCIFTLFFFFKETCGTCSILSSVSETSWLPHPQALLFLNSLVWETEKFGQVGGKKKRKVRVCQFKPCHHQICILAWVHTCRHLCQEVQLFPCTEKMSQGCWGVG